MDENHSQVSGCRYFVVDNNGDGSPCILVRWPGGKKEIVAVMTNTTYGHEHAEALCDIYNERAAQTEREAAAGKELQA